MIYIAKGCGCRMEVGMGARRPEKCVAHENRSYTEAQLRKSAGVGAEGVVRPSREARGVRGNPAIGADPSAARRRRPMKRREPKRDWTLPRAKCDEEHDLCRVCAATGTQCAHILGRKYDEPISPGSKTLLVLPDRIVPLCGELTGHGCHERYDAHELDLLPFLTAEEQAQAVLDAGSMGLALRRISPTLELAA